MKKKGFGVEDTPFMILATVAVMMLVVWIGVGVMAQFTQGNEHQSAINAASNIYKAARLVSLGHNGSSDEVFVSVPGGYSISIDGGIVALKTEDNSSSQLTDELTISGVGIIADSEIPPGEYTIKLIYASENAEVKVIW
jgi:uncharacterized protein (UPF0333 family)